MVHKIIQVSGANIFKIYLLIYPGGYVFIVHGVYLNPLNLANCTYIYKSSKYIYIFMFMFIFIYISEITSLGARSETEPNSSAQREDSL